MTATVKFVSTVDSKLSQLQVENGQLIFVSDTRKICLDFDGVRTEYSQFITLETEAHRLALLAPVRGFYFINETKCFWQRTKDGWVQLTTPPKEQIIVLNKQDFPATGEDKVLYIAQDESQTYFWKDSGYIRLGSQIWDDI